MGLDWRGTGGNTGATTTAEPETIPYKTGHLVVALGTLRQLHAGISGQAGLTSSEAGHDGDVWVRVCGPHYPLF